MASISTLAVMAHIKMMQLLPVLASNGEFTNPDGMAASGGAENFKVDNFLANFGSNLKTWGGIIIIILGVAAIIAASYMLVTGLISHGKKQTSWPVVIILFVVGGAMAFGGWNLMAGTIAGGLSQTVQSWGSGGGTAAASTILAMPPFLPF